MLITKSLAVKYRPKTFEDVVEQKAIIQILQEQLKTNTTQNCYLFTGGAGTGKTTCARILAQEINNNTSYPIEIDAASNNGVENVRELILNSKFKSLTSDYKIYIIDECHMLSTNAWNAMLKLIEEPPSKTVFIFCTTDPQKIPNTILSRVQRFDFQKLTHSSIIKRLIYILDNENIGTKFITYEEEALSYISKVAEGGMRDAITLLDKCLSFSHQISIENVINALGTVNYETMFSLTNAIIEIELSKIIMIIEEEHRRGVDLKQFIKQYITFLLDVCKYYLLNNFEYLQLPSTYENELNCWGKEEYEFLQTLLKTVIELSFEIKWESFPKSLIQAKLLFAAKGE